MRIRQDHHGHQRVVAAVAVVHHQVQVRVRVDTSVMSADLILHHHHLNNNSSTDHLRVQAMRQVRPRNHHSQHNPPIRYIQFSYINIHARTNQFTLYTASNSSPALKKKLIGTKKYTHAPFLSCNSFPITIESSHAIINIFRIIAFYLIFIFYIYF